MPDHERTNRPAVYAGRFEGGPWDGASRRVRALPTNQPRDFLFVDGDTDGAYVLAGAPREDQQMPYLWMRWSRVAMAEHLAARTIEAADPSRRRRLAREPKTR